MGIFVSEVYAQPTGGGSGGPFSIPDYSSGKPKLDCSDTNFKSLAKDVYDKKTAVETAEKAIADSFGGSKLRDSFETMRLVIAGYKAQAEYQKALADQAEAAKACGCEDALALHLGTLHTSCLCGHDISNSRIENRTNRSCVPFSNNPVK